MRSVTSRKRVQYIFRFLWQSRKVKLAMSFPCDYCGVSRLATIPVQIACGLSLLAHSVPFGSETQADVIRAIDAAERYRETNLAGYRVVEHYTISNGHFLNAS